ncbi:HEAT repeat domain-containing protein [Reichenbachiella versicolor]|uniref:HEAT repeat domain-containing protein n=1 Tax=Reichenbachiella versicolor TaxID=1821036 RepID=UPI000D6E76EB|nr:HEAT repeat domain-containing protein [Reichenbachiella versicolor]
MSEINPEKYLKILEGELSDSSSFAVEQLVKSADENVVQSLITLLSHTSENTRYLASKTLSGISDNAVALPALLKAIHWKENKNIAGDLTGMLEGFDISKSYVDIFKIYLSGSYKSSMLAKELLDFGEFDITPRVLKKLKKNWDHYSHNVKQDELYQLKSIEVQEIIDDLTKFLKNQNLIE